MKRIFLSALFLLIALGVGAQFRSTEWGMTRETVRSTEEATLLGESELGLLYSGDIAGLECRIVYYFAEDRLFQACYSVIQEHSNRNDYLDDYTNLKELLTKKYGEPQVDETRWKNTLFQDHMSEWGTAVSMGHLVYYCIWDSEDTEISLSLAGDNFNIIHFVIYKSKTLSREQDEIREKETLERL